MNRRSGSAERTFTRLYEDHGQDILAFLLRRCATAEDAADCLAETFEIAWAKRERIPTATARPWLFGVARNTMRRRHERDSRAHTAARELASALNATTCSTSAAPATPAGLNDQLLDALAELPPLDQEILTLIAWDELTPTEIAVTLDLSPNVVRVRAHRARAKLRALLAQKSKDPSRGQVDDPAPVPS